MGLRPAARQVCVCTSTAQAPATEWCCPEQDRFNFTGPFSVAVWFKVERLTVNYQRLVVKSDDTWRFQRDEARNGFEFLTNSQAETS